MHVRKLLWVAIQTSFVAAVRHGECVYEGASNSNGEIVMAVSARRAHLDDAVMAKSRRFEAFKLLTRCLTSGSPLAIPSHSYASARSTTAASRGLLTQ